MLRALLTDPSPVESRVAWCVVISLSIDNYVLEKLDLKTRMRLGFS